ncbi:MAG: hypothetical protein QGH40_05335, partial [bacterium]|nr:hypothetical protein [bacterium]
MRGPDSSAVCQPVFRTRYKKSLALLKIKAVMSNPGTNLRNLPGRPKNELMIQVPIQIIRAVKIPRFIGRRSDTIGNKKWLSGRFSEREKNDSTSVMHKAVITA